MLISFITPTGMRPEAFKLCEKWMGAQDFEGDREWIVVDDGETPTECTMGQRVLRPHPFWSEGENTQKRNLFLASQMLEGDVIFVIEDDDYYSPSYVSSMLALLSYSGALVAGEGYARYYNVKEGKYKVLENNWHCSLSQTVFGRAALPIFIDAVHSEEKFVDIEFWRRLQDHNVQTALTVGESSRVVGIKGMPGRAGIGTGHTPENYEADHERRVLANWIGEDAETYAPFFNQNTNKSGETNSDN